MVPDGSILQLKIGGALGKDGISVKALHDAAYNLRKLLKDLSPTNAEPSINDLSAGSVVLETHTEPAVIRQIHRALCIETSASEVDNWSTSAKQALMDLGKISETDSSVKGIQLGSRGNLVPVDKNTLAVLEKALTAANLSYGVVKGRLYRANLQASRGVEGGLQDLDDGHKMLGVFSKEIGERLGELLGKKVLLTGLIKRDPQSGIIKAIDAWGITPLPDEEDSYRSLSEKPPSIDDLVGLYKDFGIEDSVAYVRSIRDE